MRWRWRWPWSKSTSTPSSASQHGPATGDELRGTPPTTSASLPRISQGPPTTRPHAPAPYPGRAHRRREELRCKQNGREESTPGDVGSWELAGEQLALRCYELNEAATELESLLKPDLSALGQEIPIHNFSCRLKGQERIQNKVLRARDILDAKLPDSKKRPPYNPEDVTDAWGCRFVTLFQSHILVVMAEIFRQLEMWEKEGRTIAIETIKVYTNRPDSDPMSWAPKAKQLIENFRTAPQLQAIESSVDNQDTGYSAVHFILKATLAKEAPGEIAAEAVKFEIQIRDIFEEAWSQVSHVVSYSEKDKLNRTGVRSNGTVEMLGRPQLNALKTVADGCSQIAEQIRRTYGDLKGRLSIVDDRSTYLSLSSLDETKTLILSYIPPERADLRETVTTAFGLVKDARDAGDRQFDRRVARSNYRAAAQKFREAFYGLHGDAELQNILLIVLPDNWTIESNLKIEEANALMFGLPSKLQDDMDEVAYERACSLYRELETKDPDDPMVQLRLAQAERKAIGSQEHATAVINRLKNCLQLLGRATYLRQAERAITNQLARIELGLARHDYSERTSSRDEKVRALREAVGDLQALVPEQLLPPPVPEQLRVNHRAISNVLWFFYRLRSSGEAVLSDADLQIVRSNIEKLRSNGLWAIVRFYPETIENLMYGYDLLGETRNAEAMADHNLELLQQIADDQRLPDSNRDITELLDAEEKDIYLRALNFKYKVAQARTATD